MYNPRTLKSQTPHLQELCGKPERTCRRVVILRGIGSLENTPSSTACCDVCTQGDFPYPTLDILRPVISKRRKKNVRVRTIAAPLKTVLKENLLEERQKIIEENPSFKMIGANYICSDVVISNLCDKASFIRDVDDISTMHSLRPALRERFFNVIMDTVTCNPPPQKR